FDRASFDRHHIGLPRCRCDVLVLLSSDNPPLGHQPVRLGPRVRQLRSPQRTVESLQGRKQARPDSCVVLSYRREATVITTKLLQQRDHLVELIDAGDHSAQGSYQLVALPRHLDREHRAHLGMAQEQMRVEVQRDIVASGRDLRPTAFEGGSIHQVKNSPSSTMPDSMAATAAPALSMISYGTPHPSWPPPTSRPPHCNCHRRVSRAAVTH